MRADTAIYTAYDDVLLPDPAEPEKNLMRAILRIAIDDIKKGSGEAARSARQFFLSQEENYIYSFLNICSQLNLCPQNIKAFVGLPSKVRILVPNMNTQLAA